MAGTYLFAASIGSEPDRNPTAALVHTDPQTGGRRVVALRTSSAGGVGDANLAILQLDVLDYVSVQLLPDNSDPVLSSSAQYPYSSFSGFFLFA